MERLIDFQEVNGHNYYLLERLDYLLKKKLVRNLINLLEEKSDIKWAEDEEYQNYKDTTPILVPFLGKRKK